MTEPDTVARALDASNAWNALGSVIEDAPLARFVRSDRFAGVPSANRVSHIRASSPRAIDQVLGEVGRAFPAGAAITFDVDHRTPIEQGGNIWSFTNLQSLCHPCHSEKTRREQVTT